MSALICGSLAFDTITNFPGRFAEHILPERVHLINVSFHVPTQPREYGGSAGTNAYTPAALGGAPLPMATHGPDGAEYVQRLAGLGIDTSGLKQIDDSYTAQAIIITDADNNQISAFHPGAMSRAHENPVPARGDIAIGIIAPDGREAMLAHAQQMHRAGIPFVFDPGQGLPMFDGAELRAFVDQASWVAVNDYEGRMLTERTGLDAAALSRRPHLNGVIVTLGADGCELWQRGERLHVPGVPAEEVVDPTGCGDAFRAGLLYGLERGWTLERCAGLGNRLGAIKIAQRGGQNHRIDRTALDL